MSKTRLGSYAADPRQRLASGNTALAVPTSPHSPTEVDNITLRRAVAAAPCAPHGCKTTPSYAGALHLAVMTGPFLAMILDGTKTVESRFHRQRRDPLFTARKDDVIVFRQSGRPAEHAAVIRAAHYIDLTRTPLGEVRDRWSKNIGATSDDFWSQRSDASWASLLELDNPWPLLDPVPLRKRDRRGWVTYPAPSDHPQVGPPLFEV